MKQVSLLSKGLFNKKFMNSKATTRTLSKKEWLLGHLIGPLGLIFVVNTIAALVEKFFTQQYSLFAMEAFGTVQGGLVNDYVANIGRKYELIMTIAKVLAVGIGLLNGWLIQHTKSKQGRMRPWYLIFGFISIAIGGLIFLFPGTKLGQNYWIYFFVLLVSYHTLGSTYFYLFRDTIVSLVSRDPAEKEKLNFIRKVSWTLISGIGIGLIFNMALVPMWLEHDIMGYPILMVVISILAIPLLLLEYYYTRERVTESIQKEVGLENGNKIPLKQQIKAIISNKYLVILFILMTLQGISDNFKGGNVQYFYIKFMLGGETNYGMYTIYQVITGIPLGLGAILIYPLSKKFGIKNLTIFGWSLVLVGSIFGWMFPDNLPIAMAAGFLRQCGMLPGAYIFGALLYYAYDDAEFRSGLRLEGLLGVAVIVAIQSLIWAPFAGGYESMLANLGFIDVPGVHPNQSIKDFMTLSFYLFDIILAIAYIVLLLFVDVEKKLPRIKKELVRRQQISAFINGEQYRSQEEQEKYEVEQAAIETEQNRIADLKDRCAKKGLDFETENQKYLTAKAEAEHKRKEKQDKKQAKADAKVKAKEEKRVAALKAKCAKLGLNFDEENAKYFASLEEKKRLDEQREIEADKKLDGWFFKTMSEYKTTVILRIDEEKQREKKRVAKLKAKCAKQGLNFDEENARYLAEHADDKSFAEMELAILNYEASTDGNGELAEATN